MNRERFWIRLDKPQYVFSAAHFITYAGNICEPLHGHNYRVSAEAEGPLDENGYVLDFVAVDRLLTGILQQLDHHMLLPEHHPEIRVDQEEDRMIVHYGERHWMLPARDCTVLPIANTTAELLAHYIGRQLRDALRANQHPLPSVLRVAVDENNGQWAVCQLEPGG